MREIKSSTDISYDLMNSEIIFPLDVHADCRSTTSFTTETEIYFSGEGGKKTATEI